MNLKSIDEEYLPGFDFMVRSGRVVALPIFAGAYGRVDPRPPERWWTTVPVGSNDNGFRDLSIKWVKDLRVSIDYLETRSDIDSEHLGYFGYSFGGQKTPLVLAVEPRLKAAVVNVGGLMTQRHPPEVDGLNFVTRVRTPTLMINGRYDVIFPYETHQVPMFELLGTPPEHKVHYVTPAAHLVPQDDLFRLTFDWFDKYLGLPRRAP
jgi:dienelactone hydrolase